MSFGTPFVDAVAGPSLSSAPLAGATGFGFSIPQGEPGEIQLAAQQLQQQVASFHEAATAVRSGAQTALGSWQGPAELAFRECGGRILAVLAGNADAFEAGVGAMGRLADILERAQQQCKYAAGECQTEQQLMQAAQIQAGQHGEDASGYEQQAAVAGHPSEQTRLSGLAAAARAEQRAAQQAADDAQQRLAHWQSVGQQADREYELQATQLASAIDGAAGQVKPVPAPAGGAPVPINVTPLDRELAQTLAAFVARNDPSSCTTASSEIERVISIITPGTALAFQHDLPGDLRREQQAANPGNGNVVDVLGGVLSGIVGTHLFGNPNTRFYQGEDSAFSVVAAIPIDPASDVRDIAELGGRGVADLAEHDGESAADQVLRYGDQPSPRPAGFQAHHIFQDAAFRDVPGYSRSDAPTILMSREDHLEATAFQREAAIGGTVRAERQVAIQALIRGGKSPLEAQQIVDQAQHYLSDKLGLTLDAPVRVPPRPNFKP